MITMVVNPDKTVTLTLAGRTQTQFDRLLATHGETFIEQFWFSAFNKMAVLLAVRNKDEIKRDYDKLNSTDKQRVDDILQGRV